MGHDRPSLPLHADQLRRQGRRRTGRPADHEGAESGSEAVRPDRLVLLLPVRDFRDCRRLPVEPGADPPHAAGHGDRLVAGAVPHAGHGEHRGADRLPHHSRRRRRSGRAGRHPCDLQMVSRFAARPADGDHRPGLGARRHHRGAGAQLDHRQPFLALGVRRARRRRPDVVRAVADLRPRGHAGRSAGERRRRQRARALPLPADLSQHHRRLLRGLRELLGPGARPHLVHLVPRRGPRLHARRSAAISASCPGSSASLS